MERLKGSVHKGGQNVKSATSEEPLVHMYGAQQLLVGFCSPQARDGSSLDQLGPRGEAVEDPGKNPRPDSESQLCLSLAK